VVEDFDFKKNNFEAMLVNKVVLNEYRMTDVFVIGIKYLFIKQQTQTVILTCDLDLIKSSGTKGCSPSYQLKGQFPKMLSLFVNYEISSKLTQSFLVTDAVFTYCITNKFPITIQDL
jgi:hypothetical protein